ncbi:hypothetical protein H4Q26_007037 [Puccinia striiformis f. sp. tritici PST-130]|nr:hypothetical protein H4Q26_007037 [Puccinia striiformis f. sp. tritici PST-130]
MMAGFPSTQFGSDSGSQTSRRRQEEQTYQENLSRLLSPRALSNKIPLPSPSQTTLQGNIMNGPNHPTGSYRPMARLGYQANSFVEMQMEIAKELVHADFAKCPQLDLIRVDRNEQIRRAEVAQAKLGQAIDSEERTFKALVAEREIAKRAIDQAEKGVQQVERLAAVLYARTAEEQAAMANITAKTAAAVAMSAVQNSQAGTPRVGFAPSPVRSPATFPLGHPTGQPHFVRPTTPSGSLHPHQNNNHNHCSSTPPGLTPTGMGPTKRSFQSKLRERTIEVEKNRIAGEVARLAEDRLKLRFERDRIASPIHHHTPKVTYQDLRN